MILIMVTIGDVCTISLIMSVAFLGRSSTVTTFLMCG